jgi:hypothetical protein
MRWKRGYCYEGGGINTFRKNVIQDVRVTQVFEKVILDRNIYTHPPFPRTDWLSVPGVLNNLEGR